MQTIAPSTAEAEIDALAEIYEFRQPAEVRAYLAANPDLLPLVREAAAKIPEFMAPHGPLLLEVVQNPEEAEDATLVAVVTVYRKHESVLPQLRRLIRHWLVDAGRFSAARFVVSPEYQ